MSEKVKPKDKPHYVNNKLFSQSVVDYVNSVKLAEAENRDPPKVTDYIAECFMKIATGLSHKSNFIRYTYKEEMIMDAVENCLKAIHNYNIEAATRTGNPNAFAYFTQICYFAFIRRITKEKKQQDIKFKFIEQCGIEDFIHQDENNVDDYQVSEIAYVDQLKERIEKVKDTDRSMKEFKKIEKEKKKLELFME